MTARFRSKNIVNTLGVAVALFAAVAPCAAQSKKSKAAAAKDNAPVVTTKPAQAAAPAAPVVVPSEYMIGSDDVLKVDFWRDKDLTSDVTVRPDGKISLPLMNDIQAAGLTPAQLRDRIADAAKTYVEDPVVTVEVKAINSRKVFITGEVKKPGPYSLTSALSVLQLISIAGGLGDYAKSEKITIVRSEGGKLTSFKFNYKEVLNQRKLEQNIELKPGDSVLVP